MRSASVTYQRSFPPVRTTWLHAIEALPTLLLVVNSATPPLSLYWNLIGPALVLKVHVFLSVSGILFIALYLDMSRLGCEKASGAVVKNAQNEPKINSVRIVVLR